MVNSDRRHLGDRAAAPSTFLLIARGHPIVGSISMDVSASAFGLGVSCGGQGKQRYVDDPEASSGNTLSQIHQDIGRHKTRGGILRKQVIT